MTNNWPTTVQQTNPTTHPSTSLVYDTAVLLLYALTQSVNPYYHIGHIEFGIYPVSTDFKDYLSRNHCTLKNALYRAILAINASISISTESDQEYNMPLL